MGLSDYQNREVPQSQLRVDMGVVATTEAGNSLITTVGSCVAVCVYDGFRGIGGMAHVVHPKRSEFMKPSISCKFADVAVPELVSKMMEKGAKRISLKAKITGGANMFPSIEDEIMKIGQDNIKAVRNLLRKQNVNIVAEDVGGESGRKIEFMVGSNKLKIIGLSGETKVI